MPRFILFFIAFLAAVPALSAPRYQVTDLGLPPGSVIDTGKINNAGLVVGTYDTGQTTDDGIPVMHAFVWQPGPGQGLLAGLTDLGSLGGPMFDSRGLDINALNEISGSSETGLIIDEYTHETFGFSWRGGTMTPLPPVTDFFNFGVARAINRHSETAGIEASGLGCHPMLWLQSPKYGLPQGPNILGPLPGGPSEGVALDLNDLGQVVGEMRLACDVVGASTAFLWLPEPAYGLPAGMNNLTPGLDPLSFAAAQAINERGQIAGQIERQAGSFDRELFLWHEGTLTRLGTLPGASFTSASDINERGQIVGTSGNRALLWESGTLHDLNDLIPPDSGWVLRGATGINDLGEIVGVGVFDGTVRAFRLDGPLVFADGFETGDTLAWSTPSR